MEDKHVKDILTDVEKLSDWCVEIDARKDGKLLQEIVLSLKATMRHNNLTSLTAPQIGYNKRVFCIKFGDTDYRTFVNPMIENNTAFQFSRERCSSIPGKDFIIPRFGNVKVFFTTPLGKVESCRLAGMSAFVLQHCVDHLNGMLLSDIGLEVDELFDEATDEDRAEILKMYADSLDIRQKQLEEEMLNNPELKQVNDAVKFINSVKLGETKLESSEEK